MFNHIGASQLIKIVDKELWCCDPENLKTTDGMTIDKYGNIYVADFSANAIVKVTPEAKVSRLAQSPDSDGLNGELDQPGEPIIWNGKLIATCFDLVTGGKHRNTAHEMPATLAMIDLKED